MTAPEKYGQEQGVYGQPPESNGQQQYYAQPAPMATSRQAPVHLEKPEGEWQNGICSCGPCGSCLLAWCLPCILLGRTSERIRDPSMETADSLNSDCLIHGAVTCFTGCGWIYAMIKRGEIRERYGIQGSGCGDCCVSFWCSCCALIQQDNEVKIREKGRVNTQGYQVQPGMHMPPPQPAYHPAQ
ncbi:PLAC8 family-domain-containing protein [Xylaria bambusicola]|uniref:PLAC8 family-domain-containing protein n=1 Tax=Xylaria bambusicola TaxID=326684 RepID=UPI0020075D5C|nr:PLAC8 family-domain-containing protein [Xylaria bambusicola]KAI0525948.1 PLAC8 family-domain-containing protein [Xylaria bambusicola]